MSETIAVGGHALVRAKPEPGVPSQVVVDAVYATRALGIGATVTLMCVYGCLWALPWIGQNAVVPSIEIWRESQKSSSAIAASSVEASSSMSSAVKDMSGLTREVLEEKRQVASSFISVSAALTDVSDQIKALRADLKGHK